MNIINTILNKFGYKIFKLEELENQPNTMTLTFWIGHTIYDNWIEIKHPDNPYLDYKRLHARLDKEHFDKQLN